jgi:hypothetical protein
MERPPMAERINEAELEILLIEHFGTESNRGSNRRRIIAQLKQKLLASGIGVPTGRFIIKAMWETPTPKTIAILKDHGILVEPEVEIDFDKLKRFVGDERFKRIITGTDDEY